MPSWFSRRVTPGAEPDALGAYKEGRIDERQRLEKDGVASPAATRGDIDAAYDRGRHDERLRRRGSPLVSFVVVILALAAVALVFLAVRQGSFGAAGALVDNSLSATAQKAQAPVKGAADKAGSALVNAGQNLKDRAGAGQN